MTDPKKQDRFYAGIQYPCGEIAMVGKPSEYYTREGESLAHRMTQTATLFSSKEEAFTAAHRHLANTRKQGNGENANAIDTTDCKVFLLREWDISYAQTYLPTLSLFLSGKDEAAEQEAREKDKKEAFQFVPYIFDNVSGKSYYLRSTGNWSGVKVRPDCMAETVEGEEIHPLDYCLRGHSQNEAIELAKEYAAVCNEKEGEKMGKVNYTGAFFSIDEAIAFSRRLFGYRDMAKSRRRKYLRG